VRASLLRPVGAGVCQSPGGRHRVVPSVVCAVGVLFGIVYCFFGYRCFKAVMFLTGLLFGSAVVFLLCVRQPLPDSALGPEAAVGVAVGAGLLCGLVAMLVRSVGLFLVGLLLGLLLALALLVGLEELSSAPPRSVWAPLGLLLGSGTLCAVLTLQWPRLFTTLSTACFGAAAITVAMDYFAELLGLVLYVVERLKAAPRDAPVCWVTWAALGVWGALAALGVLVQWKVTAEGYSHTKVIISRHQRHMQVLRIRQRDDRGRSARGARAKKKKNPVAAAAGAPGNKASPAEPAYRRKPHPIRRYDGDVLSPVGGHTHTHTHTRARRHRYTHTHNADTMAKIHMHTRTDLHKHLCPRTRKQHTHTHTHTHKHTNLCTYSGSNTRLHMHIETQPSAPLSPAI
uniref:Transmembrane protein 198 n=1 Tax=Gadus morhua TaxID=8049 RepID=A0A8C5BF81_GADMO